LTGDTFERLSNQDADTDAWADCGKAVTDRV
jgi:hypothetical protein